MVLLNVLIDSGVMPAQPVGVRRLFRLEIDASAGKRSEHVLTSISSDCRCRRHHAAMGDVFIGSEAVAHGRLTKSDLRRHRAIFRDVYVRKLHQPSLRDRTAGAWLWSHRRAVVAGIAASALHGAQWVDADVPIELMAQTPGHNRPRGA